MTLCNIYTQQAWYNIAKNLSLQCELCACGLEECRVMIGLICLLACEKSEKAAGLRIGESKKIFMRHK